jgi:hypothetical protein
MKMGRNNHHNGIKRSNDTGKNNQTKPIKTLGNVRF